MTRNLHILVWIALATLITACQSLSHNDQPGIDAADPNELKVVTSGGFAAAYNILAPQFEEVSTFIGDALGQPAQVINKRGAGTLLAANYVLDQPHDGYTVFASGFSPYLSNTILEGNADYTIDDFAYLNFQWFDEDLIALNKDSEYTSLPELLEDIRDNPKTVRASVVRGSGGHLMAKLLLELSS